MVDGIETKPQPQQDGSVSQSGSRFPLGSPKAKEWPVSFILASGNRLRLLCTASDLVGDIKKRVWQIGYVKAEPSNYVFRLSNAEAFFQDEDLFSAMLECFVLYREEGYCDTLEVTVIDKKDIGDHLKRHMHTLSSNGLVRLHGPLKKRSSAGVHKWQQRYFALQDNTLFYFGSQEDYEKKGAASEVIPMGSCGVEKGMQQGVKWSLYRNKQAQPRTGKSQQRASPSSPGKAPTSRRKNTATGTSLLDLIGMSENNVDFTFRIDAEIVGKREFWFRAKDGEERRKWTDAIQAVNIQRVKRIILDVTRELSARIDQPRLLRMTDDTKEADRLMEVYAHGMYPKLSQTENFVLAEMFVSALLILEVPFFEENSYSDHFTADALPGMLRTMPLSLRALFEHIFTFLHHATSYSEVNGLTPDYISDFMAPLVFGEEPRPLHKKIVMALLEKVPKLWPLLPEVYFQELQLRFSAPLRERSASSPEGLLKQQEPFNLGLNKITEEESSPPDQKRTLKTKTPSPLRMDDSSLKKSSAPLPPLAQKTAVSSEPTADLPKALSMSPPKETRERRLGSDVHRRKVSRENNVRFPRLAFPLHFSQTSDGTFKDVVIRVVEELQGSENQKFAPGRFYCLGDLVQEHLGGQRGSSLEEVLPGNLHPFVVNYEYDEILNGITPLSTTPRSAEQSSPHLTSTTAPTQSPAVPLPQPSGPPARLRTQSSAARSALMPSAATPSLSVISSVTSTTTSTSPSVPPSPSSGRSAVLTPRSRSSSAQKGSLNSLFLPEPICLAYLAQKNMFTVMFQLTSYLANRPPMTQVTFKNNSDVAWEGLERIKKLATGLDRRKSSSGSRRSLTEKRLSLAARHRALVTHSLLDDDDDDFIDIDTSMPPSLHGNPPRRPPPLPPHRRPGSRGNTLRPILATTALSELTAALPDPTPSATPRGSESSAVDTKPPSAVPILQAPVTKQPVIDPGIAMRIEGTGSTGSSPNHSPKNGANHSPSHSPKNERAFQRELQLDPDETKEKLFKPISFDLTSSFEHVMRYSESRAVFLRFLQSEYAEENLLFSDEVKIFCGAEEHEQYEMARRIYDYYLGPDAIKQVNVRGMRTQVREALTQTDRTETIAQCTFLFLEAQSQVLALLKFGSFSRFVASPMWVAFVDSFKQREWIRMKVVKLTKFHTTIMRVLQFDSHSLTITFFKPDHTSEFTKVDITIPPTNLVNVQLSVEHPKKLKITFFKGEQRLLRSQREWKIIFRTNAERERFARLVTSNLLLRRGFPESQANVYKPQPLKIDKQIQGLVDELPVYDVASELHESWMAPKLREGWVYGEVYNESERTHPNLNSFGLLEHKEREYYLEVSALTIGSVLELGYKITESDSELVNVNLEADSRLLLLVEFLAENAHDCWAFNKMKLGWTHGTIRSEENKTHPNLVPYVDLDEVEKDWNRQAAQTVLKALLERGFRIEAEI